MSLTGRFYCPREVAGFGLGGSQNFKQNGRLPIGSSTGLFGEDQSAAAIAEAL